MITKETAVDWIEIGSGGMGVRLASLVLEDGVPLGSPSYHRFLFSGVDTVEPTIEAVQAHLPQLNREPMTEADLDRIRAHAALVWPE
jgi:hypothetical protein